MRDVLRRLWMLPWPGLIRKTGEKLIEMPWAQPIIAPQYSVGVVGVIQDERGDVLLVRHTYRHEYPWGLPSGFLEHGEQPFPALAREIKEETGLDVELSSVWEVYTSSERPLLNIIIHGRYRGGEFVPSPEVSEARFFPASRLPPMMPEQRRLLVARMTQEVSH
ncbi:MAG: NUDIX domain-containing protein [Chloroflexi bacterium]|nr:NUDIX domain-containing protein [Chloroflexota bacterium]